MNELHLFAGAGGGILGGILLGHTTVCAVEIEPYCQQVLLQRQRDGILPRFPIWDDIKTFDATPWKGKVDIVCGGFPCQDISVANPKAKGITGERSGLWSEMARVVREVEPSYVFVENSPMLVSRGFGRVLGDLAALRYDAVWGVFSAADVGAQHLRERIWILAHSMQERERRKPWKIEIEEDASDANQMRRQMGGRIRGRSAETQSGIRDCGNGVCGDWKEADFSLLGEDNVMAGAVDRINAIGNGQVPAVAELAWKTLMKELCSR